MFGEILRQLRKQNNLTQRELGKKINISDRVIGYYESGDRFPDEQTLNKIAEVFDVSVDYLLGRTKKRNLSVIKGEEIPKELRDIGVEYLEVTKELKEKGFTPEKIRNLINSIEALNKE